MNWSFLSSLTARVICLSFLLSFAALPTASLAQLDPRFDVISDQQYDLLRQVLLGTEGALTQKWGNKDPINPTDCEDPILDNVHAGVDYGDPMGAEIRSATAGEVIQVTEGADCPDLDCLSRVRIFNLVVRKAFVYIHLIPEVSEGQMVKAGQRIGTVAARGAETPHLHFQVSLRKTITNCIDGTVNPYEAVFPSVYVNGGTLGDGSITKIDSGTGAITTLATGFISPEDMTTDADGRLYVAENDFAASTSKIERINPDSTGLVIIDATICGPEGPTFSPDGDLFVNTRQFPCAHSGVWRIQGGQPGGRVDNVVPAFSDFGEGTAFLTAGPFAGDLIAAGSIIEGGFTVAAKIVRSTAPDFGDAVLFVDLTEEVPEVPVGLAVNSEGDVFVASVFKGTVLQYGPTGVFKDILASDLAGPHFLEFDASDNLYVAEHDSGNVSLIDPRGNKTVLATLSTPVGLALGMRSGRLLLGLLE